MKKLFVLIIMAIGIMLSSSGFACATDLSTNLVTDGDGNNLSSWTVVEDSGYEDHWTVVIDGAPPEYAPISPYDDAGGGNEFYDYWEIDGAASKNGQICQDIPLDDTGDLYSKIDAGDIGLNAEAYIYKYLADDTGSLEIQFLDGADTPISVGSYQSSVGAYGDWEKVEVNNVPVPADARTIRVILTALLTTNNSYVDFDGIDVQLCNLPTISITDATADLTYRDGDTITISGTASDPDSAALTISAAINGHTATDSIPSGSGSWSLSWDITGLSIDAGDYSNIDITADNGQETRTETYTGTLTVIASHKTAAAVAELAGPGVGADNTITITVKDSAGNADPDFDGDKTVTITGYEAAPDATCGSFGDTDTPLEADGSTEVVVAFTDGVGIANLTLNKAGVQTIGLSVDGVDAPSTNDLNITPVAGAAVAMQVTQDITAPAVNGESFAQQPQVTMKDQYGNICTNDDATVITVSRKDTGAWTLTGTPTATANSGVATFSGLGATNTAQILGAQLAFNTGTLPEVTSTTVTLPAPAPHVTATAAAAAAGPGVGADNSITITVKDSAGNADTDFDGDKTVTITGYAAAPDATCGNFGGTALEADGSTNVTINFTDGVGTANLTLNKAGAQTIGLSVAGVDTPAANTLNITPVPGAAAAMQVTQDIMAPAVNGGNFAQQPQVTLKDQYGNICTNDNATVITVARKDAGAWTLTGTPTATANSGVATFSGLGATNTAQVLGAQLAFNTGTLPEVTSTTVTLPAPAPHKTATAVAGSLGPIVGADNSITITVKDSAGNADTDFDGDKTVTITGYEVAPNASYGTFGVTTLEVDGSTDAAVGFTDGVGTANLTLNKAGAQTIGLSVAGVDTPAANTLNITPVPGAAAAMQVTQDITAPAVNGGNFAQQPQVTLKDQYGNICTNDNASVITVSKKDAGAWTLTGTLTATANSGAAAFSGLGATNTVAVAGAQLAFNTGALPEVTSTTVTLPVPAPHVTATAAAATGGPTAGADNTITITVKNTLGNADADFDGNKTVTITGYAASPDGTYGSFGGTALEADGSTNVTVSFTDGVGMASLRLNKAGARTIGLSVAGVDTPATNTLNITPVPGAAAAMQVTQDITAPAVNGGNFAQQPQITLKDQYGNICTNDNATVITVSRKDAGAWTLTGTLTVTANSGAAAFSGLGATNTAQVLGAQLAFNAGALPEVTSTTVTLPVPAPHVTATAAAATGGPTAGADNTITITVKNTLGNADADFDGNKTVTITGYAAAPDATYGSFEGTSLTVLEADGSTNVTVSFTDGAGTAKLKLNKADVQTIGLSVAGVDTPATNTLNITPVPGAAALMQVTQDITAPAVNGGNFAQQPQITLKDQYGNICTNDNATIITVSRKDTGAWTLTGTLAATANSGVVTFSGLGATNTVAVAGAQLAFNAGALPEVTSSAVNLPLSATGHNHGGGDYTPPAQPTQPTQADKAISDSLSATGEAKVVLGTAAIGDKAQLTPAVVEILSNNDKSLTVERSGVEIRFAPDSLMTVEMNAALADTTARVEIGIREIPAQEKAQILTQSKIGESTGLFEVGGKIFDLSAQIIRTASNHQVSSVKIENFSEPVAVTIDLSGVTLSEEEIASLTGIRYEKAADGSINAVKLGGSYDSASKIFTFYTDRFSLYGVLRAQEIKRISLQLGDNKLYVNGEQRTMDVIPEVVNNRTLVPISFIAEAMGAEVTWDNASATVGIFLKEKKIHIAIGETLPGMGTPPIIKNNRTFVPLRFVAETLGAQVLWFNSTQSIQITQ